MRKGLAAVRLPEPLDALGIERGVSAHECGFLCDGLSDIHPIERIPVMKGQRHQRNQVRGTDRKQLYGVRAQLPRHERLERDREIQLSEGSP